MKALLVVDLQHDFMPTGSLPVRGADEIIATVNALMPHFAFVVASQDWHPEDHKSFASQHANLNPGDVVDLDGISQILWPVHCVQHSYGAQLVEQLAIEYIDEVVHKGVDRNIDSYSAFFDNAHRRDTGLTAILRNLSVDEIFIVGVATDYCVKFSVLDALHLGFKVTLIADACRAVELNVGDEKRAIDDMISAGARMLQSHEVKGALA